MTDPRSGGPETFDMMAALKKALANEYVYSTTGEERFYSKRYPTRAAAIAAARADEPEARCIWTAVAQPPQPFTEYLRPLDWLFEDANERAFEDAGGAAEDFLTESPTIEQEADWERVINDWATRHGLQPAFFSVDEIESIEVLHEQEPV